MTDTLPAQLAAALTRVLEQSYLLTHGRVAQARIALDAYEEARRTMCNHGSYTVVEGKCSGCGEQHG